METWTLEHVDSATTREIGGDPSASPGGWGMDIAARTDRSMGADTVRLESVPEDFSDATEPRLASWSYGDRIIIYRDAVRWFEGEISAELREASEGAEIIGWVIDGPWKALEELTYYQKWGTTYEDAVPDPPEAKVKYIERGDVTLMQRLDELTGTVTAIKTGEQIHDLMTFAAPLTGASPLFQVADLEGAGGGETHPVDLGIFVEFVKAQDETVANLIRQLARWTPLNASWFDYSTSPPTLHFDKTKPADQLTIDLGEPGDRRNVRVAVEPNHELTVPFVKIAYQSIDTVEVEGSGSGSYDKVTYDEYPAGSTDPGHGNFVADQRKALRATVPLSGAQAAIQVQKVRTRTIPLSNDASNYDPGGPAVPAAQQPPSGSSWQEEVRKFCAGDDRWPWLQHILPTGDLTSNIGVVEFKVEKMGIDDGVSYPPGEEPTEYDLWETPRVLESGATSEWMNVKSQKVKISAKLIFKGGSVRSKNVRKFFNQGTTENKADGKQYPYVEGSWTVTATSAVSKSYERTTSQTQGETPPAGIAQHIYDELSQLRHSGSISFESEELQLDGGGGPNAYRPGQSIIITNSANPAWATMLATIQTVEQSLQNSRTTLTFGAPAQLGTNDYVTLARLWRFNPPSFTNSDGRSTGQASGSGNKTEGAEEAPKGGSGPGDPPQSDPNPFSVITGPLLKADGTPDPGSGFTYIVAPGWVMSGRARTGGEPATSMYDPIMPELGGNKLDATDIPYKTITGTPTLIWAKFKFDSEGILTGVDIDDGATLPTNVGNIGSDEHLQIAKIELSGDGAIVTQDVESNIFWPTKQKEDVPAPPSTITKDFLIFEQGLESTGTCWDFTTRKCTADFINFTQQAAVQTDLSKCLDLTRKGFYILEKTGGSEDPSNCEELTFHYWDADFINPVADSEKDIVLDLAKCSALGGGGGGTGNPFWTFEPDYVASPSTVEINGLVVVQKESGATNQIPQFEFHNFVVNDATLKLETGHNYYWVDAAPDSRTEALDDGETVPGDTVTIWSYDVSSAPALSWSNSLAPSSTYKRLVAHAHVTSGVVDILELCNDPVDIRCHRAATSGSTQTGTPSGT